MDGEAHYVEIPFEVTPLDHGSRLDVFLTRKMKRMSRSLAARVVKTGRVRRRGGAVYDKPSAKVMEGEVVVLKRKPLDEGSTDDIRVPVIHQDPRLVLVNKPGDLVVHPTASAYRRTLVHIMRERLADPGLDLAHRIDKETSGLVILTRDPDAATQVTLQFAKRTVAKAYLAIVIGEPERDEFDVEVPMRLVPDSRTKCLMEIGGAGAQHALTHFTVLARGDRAALIECRPKTGRQHQIRLHLQHLGMPIVGDKMYFGSEDFFISALHGDYDDDALVGMVGHLRQALHAYKAVIRHPDDGRDFEGVAPLPADMVALARRLKIDVDGLAQRRPELSLLEAEASAEAWPRSPVGLPACAPEAVLG